MIDLHLHTNVSDGTDSPLELLEKVIVAGCSIFSVTDHDSLDANSVILSELKNRQLDIRFVTGCEISSVFEGRNLHLLCYGFNLNSDYMRQLIVKGAKLRRQRVVALFEHLETKHKIYIDENDKAKILSLTIPGKVHITDAALKLGLKIDRKSFFDNYLDDMESREFKTSAENVISMVTKAGGIVSFAHPIEVQREYNIDFSSLGQMAKRLKDIGLCAIEAFHSLHNEKAIKEYLAISSKHNLALSAGSDYHGTNKTVKICQLSSDGFTPNDNQISIIEFLK